MNKISKLILTLFIIRCMNIKSDKNTISIQIKNKSNTKRSLLNEQNLNKSKFLYDQSEHNTLSSSNENKNNEIHELTVFTNEIKDKHNTLSFNNENINNVIQKLTLFTNEINNIKDKNTKKL
ncbi:hypothetical protein NAPIS_ORF01906 [Vairimorpha apis BRL 01]|uniref:Fam-b protein n=1 Tax=Vairimorpha apis BRL 01 TaxID=1037528 RepID=T0KZ39_9MICR|nr:hypothetical protein NAPIS_ORF01906 [Vairimorpha apis BRL 01]